jgi:hypothetical protein
VFIAFVWLGEIPAPASCSAASSSSPASCSSRKAIDSEPTFALDTQDPQTSRPGSCCPPTSKATRPVKGATENGHAASHIHVDTRRRERHRAAALGRAPAIRIELITGSALEDARNAPIGTFAGTTTADALSVGSFADIAHSGRDAIGTFAGDPDRQRRGAFSDTDRDTVTTHQSGVKQTRDATHRRLETLLLDAGLDQATATANLGALHAGKRPRAGPQRVGAGRGRGRDRRRRPRAGLRTTLPLPA